MLDTILLLVAGAFIGWNFPQPSWARWAQNWVMAKWNQITNRTEK